MKDLINKVIHGDCIIQLDKLPDNSVDTIITDPPYGLSFMGKKWDYDVPSVAIWQECLRVLKPGGTALIFAGSRTQHRMACNVEDSGFELRDCIMWLYGSGCVLDPFAGSGTTGVACQNTGRDFILIEREEEYINIIKARLSQSKQKKLL